MRKILHVSDVHFGRPHRPAASAAVLELVASRGPDLVVVAGDLTQRAKPREFRQARRWVDAMAKPALAVPGNHDVPMYRFWERLFVPFGAYRRHFDADLEPRFEDEELFAIGINSANNWTVKDGRVSPRQLRRVERALAAAPAGKTRIAVVHHELIPAPRFGSQKVLANARPLVEILAAGGVELVLSGHLHQGYCALAESYYPGVGGAMLVVHSGTTSSDRGRGCERGRNTGNWIEIAPDALLVAHLEWHAGRGAFEERAVHHFPRSGRGAPRPGSGDARSGG
ncbi:MAG: metallophosphoesterase [Acidobacteriota bacterium]|nr:metallophosphoesterase [Acidobacteriota bacterium]MDH3522477.1 metallophosphoesterase [Acidobacteriota bacterium]